MKIGDRVRFLNAVGGGVVTQIQGKGVVLVEGEDGFEIPVLARECVVVSSANNRESVSKADTSSHNDTQQGTKLAEGNSLIISFALVPTSKYNSCDWSLYLVNDSKYHLLYSCAIKVDDAKYQLKRAGTLGAYAKEFLFVIERHQIDKWKHMLFQGVAYCEGGDFEPKKPICADFSVPVSKLHQQTELSSSSYFDEPALLLPVHEDREREEQPTPDQLQALVQSAMLSSGSAVKKNKQPHRQPSSEVKRPAGYPIEIDLHIEKLIDDLSGLEPIDILNYQLNKVDEVMREYYKKRGKKIVFIHGKGNGTLRKELLKRMKKSYPQAQTQDASFLEYGFGATLVTIK